MRMPPLLEPPWLEALALLPPALLLALTDVPPCSGDRTTALPPLAVMPLLIDVVLPAMTAKLVPPVTVGEFVALPVVLLSAMANAAVVVPAASTAAPNAATTAFDLFIFSSPFAMCSKLRFVRVKRPGLGPGRSAAWI